MLTRPGWTGVPAARWQPMVGGHVPSPLVINRPDEDGWRESAGMGSPSASPTSPPTSSSSTTSSRKWGWRPGTVGMTGRPGRGPAGRCRTGRSCRPGGCYSSGQTCGSLPPRTSPFRRLSISMRRCPLSAAHASIAAPTSSVRSPQASHAACHSSWAASDQPPSREGGPNRSWTARKLRPGRVGTLLRADQVVSEFGISHGRIVEPATDSPPV